MLKLFTYPSSIDCKKVKQWLDKRCIPYQEKELFDDLVTMEELKQMTSLTEMGVIDIIAPEYLSMVQHVIEDNDISLKELYESMEREPKLLKLPILYDDKRMLVGYNEEELNKFLPKPTRVIMEY
ncbi:MAG TPA: Spx/MgsR family RNA polymerase-binding regulatory protein [Alloiococcus sp.]|nr:Spx/MgsR family RNA polymerase-binding regulatory protein [Alloiococcus sp.]